MKSAAFDSIFPSTRRMLCVCGGLICVLMEKLLTFLGLALWPCIMLSLASVLLCPKILGLSILKSENIRLLFWRIVHPFKIWKPGLPLYCYLSVALSLPIVLLSSLSKGTPQCCRPFLSFPAKVLIGQVYNLTTKSVYLTRGKRLGCALAHLWPSR